MRPRSFRLRKWVFHTIQRMFPWFFRNTTPPARSRPEDAAMLLRHRPNFLELERRKAPTALSVAGAIAPPVALLARLSAPDSVTASADTRAQWDAAPPDAAPLEAIRAVVTFEPPAGDAPGAAEAEVDATPPASEMLHPQWVDQVLSENYLADMAGAEAILADPLLEDAPAELLPLPTAADDGLLPHLSAESAGDESAHHAAEPESSDPLAVEVAASDDAQLLAALQGLNDDDRSARGTFSFTPTPAPSGNTPNTSTPASTPNQPAAPPAAAGADVTPIQGAAAPPIQFIAAGANQAVTASFVGHAPGFDFSLETNQVAFQLDGAGQAESLQMHFVGANVAPTLSGVNAVGAGGLDAFGRVNYHDVYAGVDLQFYSNSQGQFEHDWIVAAYADASQIHIAFAGADDLSLDARGNLGISTAAGDLVMSAPRLYQQAAGGVEWVEGRYVIDGNQVRFEIGAYDPTRALIIDPVISSACHEPTVVYFNNFEDSGTVGTEWSADPLSETLVGGRQFLGEFGNGGTTLQIDNLGAHNEVTVSFDLYVLRSWDGNDGGVNGPDRWQLNVVGGPALLDTTFSNRFPNAGAPINQAYPGSFSVGSHPGGSGAVETNSLGYAHPVQTSVPMDSVYHLSYTFDHTDSSVAFDFLAAGLQAITDESWGLDNVEVSIFNRPVLAAASVALVEGQAGGGVVATFTDADPCPADHYTAMIQWGDAQTSAGVVTANGSGGFDVTGSHTYLQDGAYDVVVTVFKGSSQAAVASTAVVAEAPLTNVNGGFVVTAAEGIAFNNQVVATFQDSGAIEPVAIQIANAGFETPALGTGAYAAFQYNPTNAGWTFVGGSGVAGNGSGFTSSNPNAPGGTQAAFLQFNGSFSQAVMFSEGSYTLSFAAAQRGNYQASSQTFEVRIDGELVGTFTPSGTGYATYTTNAFNVSTGSHTITFTGLNPLGGDNTAFIDQVRARQTSGVAVADGGFETPDVGNGVFGAFAYNPSGSPWTFNANSGVTGNGSGFSSGNPNAPQGDQVGFLQNAGGVISQELTFASGLYTISFAAAQRANHQPAGPQTVRVLLDGVVIGTVTPSGTGYATYTTNTFAVAAGVHTLTFEGMTNGDSTAFLDQVTVHVGNDLDASYAAAIDWGDDSTSQGTIVYDPATSTFSVLGSHTYAERGEFDIIVVIQHDAAPPAFAASTAIVANTLTAVGVDQELFKGVPFSGEVALFIDATPGNVLGDYTASIDWDDGTTATGTITFDAGRNVFVVTGGHTYFQEGTYTPTVLISTEGGAQAVAYPSFHVAAGTLIEGEAFSGPVAVFTPATAGPFSVSIDWGDGTPATAGTLVGAGTEFTVEGSHTYARHGVYTVQIAVTDTAQNATTTIDRTLLVMDAPISATGVEKTLAVGASFSGTVAAFTDANALGALGDFAATIAWGDGTTSAGTIAQTPAGGYEVSGTHTYAAEGDFAVTVVVHDVLGTSTATASTTAQVVQVLATEGSPFTGVAAVYTPAVPGAQASDFTATIDWGDGSAAGVGTLTANGLGGFSIQGAHTYAAFGFYDVTVTVTPVAGGDPVVLATHAGVLDAPLTAAGATLNVTEGADFADVLVATFTDANPLGTADEFSATVLWGDGVVSAGIITQNGGVFEVRAGHRYDRHGAYAVRVRIASVGGARAEAASTATVADAVLTPTGRTVSAAVGVAAPVTIATFADANPFSTFDDFTASIDWGDGVTTTGDVRPLSAGGFEVIGSHPYASKGVYNVLVTIQETGGSAVSVASTVRAVQVLADEGADFTADVGGFTPPVPGTPAGAFTVTIDWGDGQPASVGELLADGLGGFTARGTHTYQDVSEFDVSVAISGPGGFSATLTCKAGVVDAPIATTPLAIGAFEGVAFTERLASFIDRNPYSVLGDFTATVDWGVGAPETAVVVADGQGGFDVFGTHTYAAIGANYVTVTIYDIDGGVHEIQSLVVVDDAPLTGALASLTPTEAVELSGAAATFTDANPASVASDFTAVVDWGDGSGPTAAVVVANGLGGFDVQSAHTYERFGVYTVTVIVTSVEGAETIFSGAATVADAALTAVGRTVLVPVGAAATRTVATFTDADPDGVLEDFTASIDWGDNTTPSTGVITRNADGSYSVAGSHAYASDGSYAVAVTILSVGGASANAASTAAACTVEAVEAAPFSGLVATFTSAPGGYTASIDWGDGTQSTGTVVDNGDGTFSVTGATAYALFGVYDVVVTVTPAAGAPFTVQTTAGVANAPLVLSLSTISAVEAQLFAGVVATLTDANPNALAGDFTATIVWGDGATTTGTVVADGLGGFEVQGGHTYARAGSYTVSVAITETAPSETVTASAAIAVADAAITVLETPITAQEGNELIEVLATFTDANPAGVAEDFTATIDWGDGSEDSDGTVAANDVGGFDVSGLHTYAEPGSYTVTVTILGSNGAPTVITTTATVIDAPITAQETVVGVALGTSFSGAVASFGDENPGAEAADFTATIDWGDGSAVATGTVEFNGEGFDVGGAHTYALAGTYDVVAELAAVEGLPFSGLVSSFIDAVGSGHTAVINWGDDTPAAAGTVVSLGNGDYQVTGSHTYAEVGLYPVTITVTRSDNSTIQQTVVMFVENAPLAATGRTLTGVEGVETTAVVASFTDANPAGAAADFLAIIDWGDGNFSEGTITANPAGGFTVTGANAYELEGDYEITVTISDVTGGGFTSATSTITVADAPPGVVVEPIAAVAGSEFAGVVARFSDSDPDLTASDFSVLINWGDGVTTGAASVTVDANGDYLVEGAHTYAAYGSLPLSVVVSRTGGLTAVASVVIEVAEAAIVGAAATLPSATKGAALSGTLATFNAGSGAYSAVVDWGDGASEAVSAAGGVIAGSHTYVEAGTYGVTVEIVSEGGASTVVFNTITVASTALAASPEAVSAAEGAAFDGVVARFTDVNPDTDVDGYEATIDWGDGSIPESATLTANASGGFDVAGTHVYERLGAYTVQVVITDGFGFVTNVSTSASITDAALQADGSNLTIQRGATFSGGVASFSDANAYSSAADFAATIIWHDGATETGVITALGNGHFVVQGSHQFNAVGNFTATISITDVASGQIVGTASDFTVVLGDIALQGVTLAGVDETPLVDVVVARFSVNNTSLTAADFETPTVDWGDGQSSQGTITLVGVSDDEAFFQVAASHTYAEEGAYAIRVPITVANAPISGVAASAILVTGAAVVITAQALSPAEGQLFSGVVAAFTDRAGDQAEDYRATIEWGDGNFSEGVITALGGGAFQVSGANTWQRGGIHAVTVRIEEIGVGHSQQAFSTLVSDAALVLVAQAGNLPVENNPFRGVLASFTDADPLATLTDYAVLITWDDGTTSAGKLMPNPAGGWYVYGDHVFSTLGARTVNVRVTSAGGAIASVNVLVNVQDAPLYGHGIDIVAPLNESTGPVAVAWFTDHNPLASIGEYQAIIDWGDGSAQDFDTEIVVDAAGTFYVYGAHTYDDDSAPYTIEVYVVQVFGGDNVVETSSTATVYDCHEELGALIVSGSSGNGFQDFAHYVLSQDGEPYFDNTSQDGSEKNIGYFLTKTGAYVTTEQSPELDPEQLEFWGTTAGGPDSGITFSSTGADVDATFVLTVAGNAGSNVLGYHDDEGDHVLYDPSVDGPVAGQIKTFTPVGSFAFYMSNAGAGHKFYSDTSLAGHTDGTQQHFAVFRDVETETLWIGVEDLPGEGNNEGVGDFNDLVFSLTAVTTPAACGLNFTTTENVPFTKRIAEFTPLPASDEFSAVIDWGDGSEPELTAEINALGDGRYEVVGSHTYPDVGNYPITVTITSNHGTPTLTAHSAGYAANAVVAGTPAPGFTVNVGQAFNNELLGVFFDPGAPEPATEYEAWIDWDDNPFTPPDAGTIIDLGNGVLDVRGGHTYDRAGEFDVRVEFRHQDVPPAYVYVRIKAQEPPLRVVQRQGEAAPLVVAEGQTLNALLAKFTSSDFTESPGAGFTAVVEWGDGTSDVVAPIGAGGIFFVGGSHDYAADGSYHLRVTLIGPEGVTTEANTTVTVIDPAPVATLVDSLTYNVNAFTADTIVARFTDPYPEAAATYTAEINWGDGTVPTQGEVVSTGGNTYAVRAHHAYANPGKFTARIRITDNADNNVVTTTEINILPLTTPAPIAAESMRWESNETFERADITVARFSHSIPILAQKDCLDVTIDWGDGSAIEKGKLEDVPGQPRTWNVKGTHTYREEGAYQITVTITDDDGNEAVVRATAIVNDLAHEAFAAPVATSAGVALTNLVAASFTDVNTTDRHDAYTAVIDWGDGATDLDADVYGAQGRFWAAADHAYAAVGVYTAAVSIYEDGHLKRVAYSTVYVTAATVGTPALIDSAFVIDTYRVANTLYTFQMDWDDGAANVVKEAHAGPGAFSTALWHTYGAAGTYVVATNVAEGLRSGSAAGALVAVDAVLELDHVVESVNVKQGEALTDKLLAAFRVTDPGVNSVDVVIDWGDGTPFEERTINVGNQQTFEIRGSHTYQKFGTFDVTIVAKNAGGVQTIARSVAEVVKDRADLEAVQFSAIAGRSTGDVTVAYVTNVNPADPGLEIYINWGDGSVAENGRLVQDGNRFKIVGNHTYAEEGVYCIEVSVVDQGGAAVTYSGADVGRLSLDAFQRGNDPERGHILSYGEAMVAPNTGGLRLSHVLDFDLNPGTSVGRDPALYYNSETVDVRPIIEFQVSSQFPTPPQSIIVHWTLDGVEQDAAQFTVTAAAGKGGYLFAVQAKDAMQASGLYDWEAQVEFVFQNQPTMYVGLSGEAAAVVRDQSPLGAGWAIAGVDQLVFDCGQDILYVYGTGDYRIFEHQDDGTYQGMLEDFGKLEKVVAAGVTTYVYTDKHEMKWTFDAEGLMTKVTDPHELTVSYTYDAQQRLTNVQTPDGATTQLVYSGTPQSGIVQIVEPGHSRTLSLTISGGDLQKIVDVDFNRSSRTFEYDGKHKLKRDQWSPLDASFNYNAAGLLTTVNRGLGTVYTVAAAAGFGLGGVGPATVQQMHRAYDERLTTGATASITDGLSHTSTYVLDQRGRVEKRERPEGIQESFKLDKHGLITEYVDPLQRATVYVYEVTNNPQGKDDLLSVRYADTTTEEFKYDSTFHRMTEHKDERGNRTTYTLNAQGDVVEIKNALNEVTTYTYFESTGPNRGLVKTVTDARGNKTEYTYDGARRLSQTTEPLGRITTYTYDAIGNVAEVRNARGLAVATTYDGRNQLRSRTERDGSTTTWDYNAYGQVTRKFEPTTTYANPVSGKAVLVKHVTAYRYDQRGLLESTIVGEASADWSETTMTYDAATNLKSMTTGIGRSGYDHQATTTYAYDKANRLTGVTEAENDASAKRLTTYVYDKASNQLSVENGRGVVTSYAYDDRNRVTEVFEDWRPVAAPIASQFGRLTTFRYDAVGNVLYQQSGGSTDQANHVTRTTFIYDDLNRVTDRFEKIRDADYRRTQFGYDEVGNALFTIDGRGTVTSSAFDALNQVTAVYENWKAAGAQNAGAPFTFDRVTRFTYDKVGNVASMRNARNVVTSYVYDARDRLTHTYENWVSLTQFDRLTFRRFDALNNLVVEVSGVSAGLPSNPRDTRYIYDALNRATDVFDGLFSSAQRHTRMVYDAAGNVRQLFTGLAETNLERSHPVETVYRYDALNRKTEQASYFRHQLAAPEAAAHAALDERGNVKFQYDAQNNLVRQTRLSLVGVATEVTSYTFDRLDQLIRVVEAEGAADADGRKIERHTDMVYDGAGNMLSRTTGLAHPQSSGYAQPMKTDYKYDLLNRVTDMIEGKGATVVTPYGSVLQDERKSRYIYDANDNLLNINHPNGSQTTFAYDALNQQTAVAENWEYRIGANRQLIYVAGVAVADFERRTTREFDPVGNIRLVTVGESTRVESRPIKTRMEYDNLNQVIETVEALDSADQRTTTIRYDGAGNRILVVTGQSASAAYANVARTFMAYDAFGRLTDVHEAFDTADARVMRVTYDAADNRIRETRGESSRQGYHHLIVTKFRYDAQNRQIAVTDGLDHTTAMGYDGYGNMLFLEDAEGNRTEYEYNALNQRVLTRYPAATDRKKTAVQPTMGFVYDAAGNVRRVISSKSLLNDENVYEYNVFGQKIKVTDANGKVTRMGYDAMGNLTVVIDPDGNRTQSEYTNLNQLKLQVDPRDKESSYVYDALGRLRSAKDRKAQQHLYQYDDLNRLKEETSKRSDGTTEDRLAYTYDAAGNLLTAKKFDSANNDTGLNYRFTYNALNQARTVDGPFGLRLENTYDALGNRIRVTDSYRGLTTSVYDDANRLARRDLQYQTEDRTLTTLARVEMNYTARNQVSKLYRSDYEVSGASLTGTYRGLTSFQYDAGGRMAAQHDWLVTGVGNPGPSPGTLTVKAINLTTYSYDAGQRVDQLFETRTRAARRFFEGEVTTSKHPFTYDAADQLKNDGRGNSYSYTANGTRLEGNDKVRYNQLIEQQHGPGLRTEYRYDDEGNLQSSEFISTSEFGSTSSETTYEYDTHNRLTAVKRGTFVGAKLVDYVYDALGNRVQQKISERARGGVIKSVKTIVYAHDGEHVLAELDGDLNLQRHYLRGDAVDQWFGEVSAAGQAYWYATDRQGSIRNWFDGAGADPATNELRGRIDYTGFGTASVRGDASAIGRYRYTGREQDVEARLHYHRSRYYDPETGRWNSQDPIGLASGDTNPYRYAFNSPTNYSDPSGQIIPLLVVGGLILGGAVIGGSVGGGLAYYDATSRGLEGDELWSQVGRGALVGAAIGGAIGSGIGAGYAVGAVGAGGAFAALGGAGLQGGYSAVETYAATGDLEAAAWSGGMNGAMTAAMAAFGGVSPAGAVWSVGGSVAGALALGGYAYAQDDPEWRDKAVFGSQVGGILGGFAQAGAMRGWGGLLAEVGQFGAITGAGMLLGDGAEEFDFGLMGLGGFAGAEPGGAGFGGYAGGGVAGGAFLSMGRSGYGPARSSLAFDAYGPSVNATLQACFAAGTPLRTPDGSKPIEQFRPGDLVLSRSEFEPAGPVEAKVVEEVFVRVAPILNLHLCGRIIQTTGEHPFYVQGQGWLPCKVLQAGDLLATADGWLPVEGVADSGEVATVYNLRVAEWHTYFVGGEEWSWSLWAHNIYTGKFKRLPFGKQLRTYQIWSSKTGKAYFRKIVFTVKTQRANFAKYYLHDSKGKPVIERIKYTGSRKADFALANTQRGVPQPKGYTWHHLDYDPATKMGRMVLVKTDVHKAVGHHGAVEDWQVATGKKYRA